MAIHSPSCAPVSLWRTRHLRNAQLIIASKALPLEELIALVIASFVSAFIVAGVLLTSIRTISHAWISKWLSKAVLSSRVPEWINSEMSGGIQSRFGERSLSWINISFQNSSGMIRTAKKSRSFGHAIPQSRHFRFPSSSQTFLRPLMTAYWYGRLASLKRGNFVRNNSGLATTASTNMSVRACIVGLSQKWLVGTNAFNASMSTSPSVKARSCCTL